MTVRRLYAPLLPDAGGEVEIDATAARHARVLRLRAGDDVVLFDGKGKTARGRLVEVGERVRCAVEPPQASERGRARVVLMLGIPKGSKLDDCVRMATELGADEIALLYTDRTVPRWDHGRAQSRLDRLTRIAIEAAAQCERDEIPIVHPPRTCAECLDGIPATGRGVLFGARAEGRLELDPDPEAVWCAIGPEGGFTEEEIALFGNAGFSMASLSTRVLRVDTAVPAALALIGDRLGDVRQAR